MSDLRGPLGRSPRRPQPPWRGDDPQHTSTRSAPACTPSRMPRHQPQHRLIEEDPGARAGAVDGELGPRQGLPAERRPAAGRREGSRPASAPPARSLAAAPRCRARTQPCAAYDRSGRQCCLPCNGEADARRGRASLPRVSARTLYRPRLRRSRRAAAKSVLSRSAMSRPGARAGVRDRADPRRRRARRRAPFYGGGGGRQGEGAAGAAPSWTGRWRGNAQRSSWRVLRGTCQVSWVWGLSHFHVRRRRRAPYSSRTA
jgi:hypothetical protein